MSQHGALPDEEYNQLEEFISRTPRGRAFLRDHWHRARAVAVDEVQVLFAEVREQWQQQSGSIEHAQRIAVLRRELQDMSASISEARREIAAIKPSANGKDRILTATNELDAIVLSTERASLEILNAAEAIMDLLSKLPGGDIAALTGQIENHVISIFTACSFQDLTGQRTTKVVNVLRYIEQRINRMIEIWGVEGVDLTGMPSDVHDSRPDAHLLHGPSLHGISQHHADRVLAGETKEKDPAELEDDAARAPASAAGADEVVEEAEAAGFGATPTPLDQSAIDALFG
ncbi:MAG: hypothetical protein P4M00_07760 [Azospirillaceae bacterium]|nr:hypothetical protein [Azospirillaceae bacterium]